MNGLSKTSLGLVIAIFLVWLGGCGLTGSLTSPEKAGVQTLTILHVNDTHSHLEESRYGVSVDLGEGRNDYYLFLGSYARLTAKVRDLMDSQNDAVFLHAGDLVQGTLYYNKYHGAAGVRMMNLTPPHAMVVGNHEFDTGPERLFNIINQARFPVLGGNVDASADPFLTDLLPPYVIEEINGERVGIIGLATPDTASNSQPEIGRAHV